MFEEFTIRFALTFPHRWTYFPSADPEMVSSVAAFLGAVIGAENWGFRKQTLFVCLDWFAPVRQHVAFSLKPELVLTMMVSE